MAITRKKIEALIIANESAIASHRKSIAKIDAENDMFRKLLKADTDEPEGGKETATRVINLIQKYTIAITGAAKPLHLEELAKGAGRVVNENTLQNMQAWFKKRLTLPENDFVQVSKRVYGLKSLGHKPHAIVSTPRVVSPMGPE